MKLTVIKKEPSPANTEEIILLDTGSSVVDQHKQLQVLTVQ